MLKGIMPRESCIDATGTPHHVIGKGINRQKILVKGDDIGHKPCCSKGKDADKRGAVFNRKLIVFNFSCASILY